MDPERIFTLAEQNIVVKDFESDGPILDIGGGGEGLVGRIKGDRVVAIDLTMEELEEAPPGPVKLVMDARDMQFADHSFSVVTAFFSMMYISRQDRRQVFREVRRVLKPGGRLLIWDVVIPPIPERGKDIFVVPLQVTLPGAELEVTYGVLWPGKEQDLDWYLALARELGFTVSGYNQDDQVFYLELSN